MVMAIESRTGATHWQTVRDLPTAIGLSMTARKSNYRPLGAWRSTLGYSLTAHRVTASGAAIAEVTTAHWPPVRALFHS